MSCSNPSSRCNQSKTLPPPPPPPAERPPRHHHHHHHLHKIQQKNPTKVHTNYSPPPPPPHPPLQLRPKRDSRLVLSLHMHSPTSFTKPTNQPFTCSCKKKKTSPTRVRAFVCVCVYVCCA
ncbi:hypothetical protein DM02DRAFT_613444 [Periconia macrospinosa]|uniref:Uncharacterized protein n=1 Tax=Periconia macrospinosa TaxID=97972 RepID=A0A2V1DU43_9PLEO|nr:hypothetical protein DM02DRAFT_613444 [Periconia macrospinosa]